MIFQTFDLGLDIVMSGFLLIFLMILMLVFYAKFQILPLVIVLYLFSVVIGVLSLQKGDIPFSPYFQSFFLLFQSVLFILTIIDYKKF